jgi:metaxin
MPQPPKAVAAFFSYFPLKTYPPIEPATSSIFSDARPTRPTLWISPPRQGATSSDVASNNLLSADVECLKWQAYLALRGLSNVKVRWDIYPEGALDSRLPNLHLPQDEGERLDVDLTPTDQDKKKKKASEEPETKLYLYSAPMIPSWVDLKLGVDSASDPLEGYIDATARDESRAWVSLLEGTVHGALLLFAKDQPSFLSYIVGTSSSKTSASDSNPLQTILSPPPAPLTGFASLLPAFGARVNPTAVLSQYREAIASLSERLGTDKWFLGSR